MIRNTLKPLIMNTQQLPQLSIGGALKAACNKIFQFNGRSRRSEFWWTALVVLIINAITQDTISWLMYLLMIPITFRRLHDTGRSGWWWGAGIIATYAICIILAIDLGISSLIHFPSAAVSAFLGKFILFAIAYIAYHIVMIVFLCQDSEPFENRYGESPKYVVDPDSDGIDTPDAKID